MPRARAPTATCLVQPSASPGDGQLVVIVLYPLCAAQVLPFPASASLADLLQPLPAHRPWFWGSAWDNGWVMCTGGRSL